MRAAIGASPAGILAGDIREPFAGSVPAPGPWITYYSFLNVANGARLGAVELWSAEELSGRQFLAADLPSEEGEWLVIGQLDSEVLALSSGGRVALGARDAKLEWLGTFEEVLEALLSGRYRELIGSQVSDEWWEFLGLCGLR